MAEWKTSQHKPLAIFLTRPIFPLDCAITFIVLLVFLHRCGTCKTLRLSVFNKELLTYLLNIGSGS